jgi:hypothetical protein
MQNLNSSGQLLQAEVRAIRPGKPGVPTVAEVVQEHIDLLVRPSPASRLTSSVTTTSRSG